MARLTTQELLAPAAVGALSAGAALFSANARKVAAEKKRADPGKLIQNAGPLVDYGMAVVSVGGYLTDMLPKTIVNPSTVAAAIAVATRRAAAQIGAGVLGLTPKSGTQYPPYRMSVEALNSPAVDVAPTFDSARITVG